MTKEIELVDAITKGIQEKKGQKVNVMDLRGLEGAICNYFIVCQGNSPSQVEAITDSVEAFTHRLCGENPIRIIGRNNDIWVAMDYSDVMVHIFMPDAREYYNLENLWEDAKTTVIPDIN